MVLSISLSVSAQNLPKQRFKLDLNFNSHGVTERYLTVSLPALTCLGFCDSIDLSTSVTNDWWEMGQFQGLLCEICIDMLELGEV